MLLKIDPVGPPENGPNGLETMVRQGEAPSEPVRRGMNTADLITTNDFPFPF
jgi:hypothetical protein